MTETPLPSPSQILAFLDQAATDLDSLGKRLENAHLLFGEAEAEYEEKRDEALIEILNEYEGRRLPGEDVRLALAHKRMDFSVYVRFKKAKRLVEGINARVRRLETAVNARQSSLKALREGSGLEGYGKTAETFPGHPPSGHSPTSNPENEWRNA